MKMPSHLIFGFIFLFVFCHILLFAQESITELPDVKPKILTPYSQIDFSDVNEASGLVKSRMWQDVFWTLNDSGDEARIFPINSQGEILKPDWMKNYRGIHIPDAVNVDWESIATDNQGNLIIGDCGNNSNTRRDLALYIVKEPYPWETVTTRVFKKIQFYYPEQHKFPAKQMNFDAEAIFWSNGFIYILTKHRSNSKTRLYRIDPSKENIEIPAEYVEEFNIQGMVTGADIDSSGNNLVVLTEFSIWLFEKNVSSDKFFEGKKYWLPVDVPEGEAISFNNGAIIILTEEGKLFKINKKDMYLVN